MANNQKIAWVTGGRGGIGSAVVEALVLQNDYAVQSIGRDEENDIIIDLIMEEDVAFYANMNESPNILVTCHAARVGSTVEGIIEVDLLGVHNVCKHFISKMIKNEWGRIINLTSYHTQGTYPEREGYAAAKSGVAGYTRSLALTLAKYNITCNCVAPGVTDTPRTREFIKQGLVNEEALLKRTPLRRFAQPEDVANLVAFLASDKAEFITGQEIFCDGGYGISNYAGDY